MTFEVTPTEDTHRFTIATRKKIIHNESSPSFLQVRGNDDFEDGETSLRTFNLRHVVDYGWTDGGPE